MIGTIIVLIPAVISFVLSYRQYNEKGALLNNTYIYASGQEREKMDQKPYYRQSAVIFLMVGVIFLILAADMYFRTTWLVYCSVLWAVLTVVYAIVSSIRIKKETIKIFSEKERENEY